jgi:LppP/LprE lipoprotein
MRALRPGALLLAAALAAGMMAGCSSRNDNPTIQSPSPSSGSSLSPTGPVSGSPTKTATPAASPTRPATPAPSASGPPSASPTKPAAGPSTTIQSAEAYVQSKSDQAGGTFQFIGADSTWQAAATLHVIHATPANAASYGGDYYFFFVNGNPVGQFYFTGAVSERAPDANSFAVTYNVYKPGDPHCCPTGGTGTTTFRWTGSTLVHDPTPGATQN